MTPYQQWLFNQSKDFKRGFDACAAGETDDISETQEWHRGYEECRRVLNEENQKFC